jgi:Undecaprenyl-phosphate galactose phosphotransferase WbaP
MVRPSEPSPSPIQVHPSYTPGVSMCAINSAELSTAVSKEKRKQLSSSLLNRHSRAWMASLLVLSDLFSLTLAGIAAVYLRTSIGRGLVDPPFYLRMLPLELIFIGFYTLRGLYPAVGISPVEELRRLTISTSAVFFFITAYAFWVRSVGNYSRLVLALAWIFSLVTVQLGRWFVRILAGRLRVWGEPIAVVGYGPQGRQIVEFLRKNNRFGLRPELIIAGFWSEEDPSAPLPQIHLPEDNEHNTTPIRPLGISTAILILPEIPESIQNAIIDEGRFGFKHLIVISSLGWIGSLGVTPYDLEGILGLEVRQNLLNLWERGLKRLLDVVLVVLGSFFGAPLMGLIALLIRLDSRGPVFYGHQRIGRGGREIKVWKFRTMVDGADQALDDYLELNPQAREEWETTHKLKDDPRITRMGRFLRKTSLDELPQIWNVLKGEMSLVGPRPIVQEEIRHYQHCYKLYSRVRPGLTGLWQVSGRNNTDYDFRVRLDEYYVRNWSVWLDIYILLRTVWVVLKGDGAY